MRKNINEPKSKKVNSQNKLKKALYPQNSKPITLETYIGLNNQKAKKKTNSKKKPKTKNKAISPPPSQKTKNNNSQQLNKSQNNSNILELDYLNFSRIDTGLRKLNSSFDEDMFNSKIVIKEKNELASNRYNGIESSFDTSKTENNTIVNNNNNYIRESNEKLLKTPSTVCNYYDKSEATTSQKKNNINNNANKIEQQKNELRKNLDKLYEESKNEDIEYINYNKENNNISNIINWKLKDSIKITKNKEKEKKEDEYSKTLNENKKELNKLVFDIKRDFAKKQSQKKISKNNSINANNYKSEYNYKNNLMENYLNSKINKRKNSYNTSSSKKNLYFENMNNIPKEISKTLKYTNDTIKNNYNSNTVNVNNINNTQDINSLINVNYNSTLNTNNPKIINCKTQNKKANNTTNGIYYINSNKKIYKPPSKHSAQKPIILCYDQMKYDSYFVTPKNTKKIIKGKVQTSNKSTKFDSNSRGVGTNNTKNKSNNNNNKNNNDYIFVNTLLKTKNKSFNKNINNNFNRNKNNINNNIIYINNDKIKSHKSSTLLIRQTAALSNNKGRNSQNSNINTILKLLNSGVKKNSQLLQDLLSKVNYSNSNTKSPLKKYKSSNALKISKTLTEQNILNRMQVTPKYNKIPKGGNALTTTLVKRNIYIGSNGKNINSNNNKAIKYHNSTVKKNNNQFFGSNNNYKDILTNLFNHKTQSDFKTNKYFVLNNSNINSNQGNKYLNNNNNEYGMDKHIKQKLLDRMNNATTNGWQYVFRGNKTNNNNNGNKKILMENLSEIMKSPEKKDFINNDTIISNESDEDYEKK